MSSENPYATPVPPPPLSVSEEKTWAIVTHVLGIFFAFVPALVLFLVFKDRGPFVRNHVVTEWNFQLTLTIVDAVGFIVSFSSIFGSFLTASARDAGAPPSIGLFFLGYFLVLATAVIRLIFCIIAAVKAGHGEFYRIPIAIRFAKDGRG